jgi:hypothetical protein
MVGTTVVDIACLGCDARSANGRSSQFAFTFRPPAPRGWTPTAIAATEHPMFGVRSGYRAPRRHRRRHPQPRRGGSTASTIHLMDRAMDGQTDNLLAGRPSCILPTCDAFCNQINASRRLDNARLVKPRHKMSRHLQCPHRPTRNPGRTVRCPQSRRSSLPAARQCGRLVVAASRRRPRPRGLAGSPEVDLTYLLPATHGVAH